MFGLLFNKKTKSEQKFLEDKILKNKCRLALLGDGVFLEKAFEYISSKKIIPKAFCAIEQKSNSLNLKQITPADLKKYTVVICCPNSLFKKAEQIVLKSGCKNYIFYYDCFYDIDCLSDADYRKYFQIAFPAFYNLCVNYQFKAPYGTKILPYLELVITEKCSLKCKNCANLMQYYKNPAHENFKRQMKALENLIKCYDQINILRLIGGEPLLNRQLCAYIKKIFGSKLKNKIKAVEIITNGTIMPDKRLVSLIKKHHIFFTVSSYDVKTGKFNAIIKQSLKDRYFLSVASGDWIKCGTIKDRGKKMAVLNFIHCFIKNLNTVKNGRFYVCPFAAHALSLKAVPSSFDESVNLINNKEISREIAYLKNKKYLEVCRYCHIENIKMKSAKPAEQIKHAPAYKVYK